MKPNKIMKITKEQQLVMQRTIRRNIDIESGYIGCQHKAHKLKTDYNRKLAKKVVFEY